MSRLPWIELAILAPLLGALLILVIPTRSGFIGAIAAIGTAIASAAAATRVALHGTIRSSVGGWPLPLGIQLRADGFAALMLVVFAAIGALVSAHAIAHFSLDARRRRSFLTLWLFAWTGLNALLVSGDAFNLYVTLELTTLAAVALVAIDGDRAAVGAALRYLLFAIAGSLLYLLGVAFLYGAYGALDLERLRTLIRDDHVTRSAVALITLGLALKAALFPLHAWLAGAYANAPSPVAALLSAVLGKCSIYVLIRVWQGTFAGAVSAKPSVVIGALGAASVLWASALAFRQQRLRLLVGYSSIAQLGYVFLVLPINTSAAVVGGAYQLVSHACAAAAMFLAVDAIERAAGHDDVDRLHGLAHHIPLTFVAFGLAGASAIGLPPSGGFIAKWLLLRAALDLGEWWWATVPLIGGLMTAAYVFRVLRGAFLPAPVASRSPVPRGRQVIALSLALIALALGLAPSIPLGLLAEGMRS